ncbi:hypothetical protein ACWDPI_39060, partial [Streptomyces zhihengii]
MPTILGQNQYGKAENRVVKITRDGDTHHIKDLNVSVALSGDMEDVHYSGSNANVLPTDTTKNTTGREPCGRWSRCPRRPSTT